MDSNAVRDRFIDDHMRLRGKAAILRSLARGVLRGDRDLVSAMRLKARDLQKQLVSHMRWEEESLAPLMHRREVGSVDRLYEDHECQRERLADSLISVEGIGDEKPEALAHRLLELVRWLTEDMDEEEERILNLLDGERRG